MLSWSFGILLYEVFSAGELPYKDLENGDVLPSIQEGRRLAQPALCPVDMYDISHCGFKPRLRIFFLVFSAKNIIKKIITVFFVLKPKLPVK